MEQPEGFKMEKGKVWQLHKALYSLKQGAVAWWKECDKSMHELHFKRSLSDAGIFIYIEGNKIVIAINYVDDALWMGNDMTLL